MRETEARERRVASRVAMGEQEADLVLRGGRVLNVHTGLIGLADVAIAGARIAATGDVEHCVGAKTDVVDCAGLFLLPGFIDAHVHLGGSQLTVQRLAEVLVPHGTVALCTDFYEICTIGGLSAALHELNASDQSGLEILLSPFNAAVLGLGAFGNLRRFSYDDLITLIEHEACVELREWNCWADRLPIEGQHRAYETALRLGRTVAGHLDGLAGRTLQASAALGVMSDHEAVSTDEAVERVENGMVVQVRQGSAARDFSQILPAITERGANPDNFAFCTDEQELASMVEHGHIDRLIRRAISAGVPSIDAVRMATLNAARSIGIEKDFGSIAPGRIASIVAVSDLATLPIDLVVSRGVVAARDGGYLLEPAPYQYPASARSTVRLDAALTEVDFELNHADALARMRVIGITPGSLITTELIEDVHLVSGRIHSHGDELAKIAVIDRHDGGSHRTTGLIRGFGIGRGAIAATVNPGMMNLMCVGVDEGDMALASNRVAELGGGIAVAVDGTIIAEVSLPLYGILSDAPSAVVAQACRDIEKALKNQMECGYDGLISAAGFACLAVSMPSLKITSEGLARVERGGETVPVNLFVADDAPTNG